MTRIPPKPGKPSLRAAQWLPRAFLEGRGVDVDAELGRSSPPPARSAPSSSASTSLEARNNGAGSVVAQVPTKHASVAAAPHSPGALVRAVDALSRSQRRSQARAARDRLGHKYGARAKARKRAALDKRRRADERYEKRFRERSKGWLADAAEMPRMIPRRDWLASWDVCADGTGAALHAHMRRSQNPVALGAAVHAALGCDAQGQNPTRTWASLTARRIMAAHLLLERLAAPDRKVGGWTGGIVRGVPLGAIAKALTPPGLGERAPHRNALTGRHRGRGSDRRRGQLGYLEALEATGACFSRQPRVTERDVQPFEVGRSGYVMKRYWLASSSPSSATTPAMRELLIALHRAGRLAVLGRPRAVQKPAVSRAQHPAAPALEAPS